MAEKGSIPALLRQVEDLKISQPKAPKAEKTTPPTVFILRGLPGSGKSTLARSIVSKAPGPSQICSADDFFMTSDGLYAFNHNLIGKAHDFCRKIFDQSLHRRLPVIVVDNTHSKAWEYKDFVRSAEEHGYAVRILEISCSGKHQLGTFARRTTHGVPFSKVLAMHARWQRDSSSEIIMPGGIATHVPRDHIRRPFVGGGRDVVLYSAVFLTGASRRQLLRGIPPVFSEVLAEHMTIHFKPSPQQVRALSIGAPVRFNAVGVVQQDGCQAVAVEDPTGLCTNACPHVTISTLPSVPGARSNSILKEFGYRRFAQPLPLEGTVGVVTANYGVSKRILTAAER